MGDLTRHFDRKEYSCPCCGLNKVSPVLAKYVEIIRTEINVPINIISGTRCEKHNEEVGGVPDSSHLGGYAADITAIGYTSNALGKVIKALWKKGRLPELQFCYLIGSYSVHLDVDISKKHKRWRVFAF